MALGRVVLVVLLAWVCLSECGNTNVYTDGVLSPFSDYSWGTHTSNFTGVVHSGKNSLSFTPASYSAAYFFGAGQITPSKYAGLSFWIYRPANGPTNIHFNLVVNQAGTATKVGPDNAVITYLNNNWPATTWVQGYISFANFPVQLYDGFFFQDQSGAANSIPIYLDDITLIGASSTSTSATSAASTTTTTTGKTASTTTTGKAATTTTTTTGTAVTSTTGSSGGNNNGAADPDVVKFYSSVQSGHATYYGAYTNGGSCMLDPTPPTGLSAAGIMNTVAIASYMTSRTCGMCISVTGTGKGSGAASSAINGTRLVFVNNNCPSCDAGGLDMGLNGDGVWDISWKAVPCPVGSGKIQYIFKSGSSPNWLGLQPRNTKYPVYKFAIKVSGAWVAVPRMDYNYFVASFSGLAFPIQIQMTSIYGEVLTDTISSIVDGVFGGNVQFT